MGALYPLMLKCIYIDIYICGSQCVQVFQAHPRIFCPSSQLVFHIDLFTCVPPPRGPALCWRQRCPGVSRQRWGSALLGHDTTPKHTSFSSPSPVEMGKKGRGETRRDSTERAFLHFSENFRTSAVNDQQLIKTLYLAWDEHVRCNLLYRLNAVC